MKNINKRFSKVRLLIPSLLTHYLNLDDQTKSLIKEYLDVWEKSYDQRGLVETLSHYKKVRLCFTKYLCGQPILSMENVDVSIHGIPKEIRSL